MTRRIFTYLVLVFSLLFTGVFLGMPTAKAQQVSFSLSPNTISPNVGDVVSLNVVVTNFTNITSLQLAIDWDPLLFDTVKPMIDNITLANPSGFDSGVQLPNTLRVSWVPGSSNGTVPNGQAIFRIRFKVKAASSNYWARFLTSNTELEVPRSSACVRTPVPPGWICASAS